MLASLPEDPAWGKFADSAARSAIFNLVDQGRTMQPALCDIVFVYKGWCTLLRPAPKCAETFVYYVHANAVIEECWLLLAALAT